MKPLLLSFLAGLASACGFEPIGFWPLTLASLAALAWLVRDATGLRSALARGWWFGLGNFVLGLNWIATSFTYQANMPAWLGWVAVVLLSLYLALYPAMAAGLAWRHGREDRLRFVLVLAAAWIVAEWLRATLFTGFAWNPIGVVLLPTFIANGAKLVGTYGLSGITILLSGSICLLLQREWTRGGLLLAAIFAGAAVLHPIGVDKSVVGPRLRIVQPNIGQEEKWQEGFGARNLERLAGLSRTDATAPRLLLWPEAAITIPLEDGRHDPYYQRRAALVRAAVANLLGPQDLLLTGGLTLQSRDGERLTSATNSIFAIDRSGRILARYDKAHLVPYGEYLPMRPFLSALGLSRLAPGDVDFEPGPGPRTIDLPVVGKAGFQLCYEIIFSGQVVERTNRPAFLFNPSNDAWFGAWGPPQHLAQARLRAVEEGLPVLRATPTGISAVIDADGALRGSIGWRKQGVVEAALPSPRPPTPFARLGNLLPLLFALLLGAGAIAVRRKAR